MKSSTLFIFTFLILLNVTTPAQTTYFIKYKDKLSNLAVEQKINQHKLNKQSTSIPSFKVNYFAGGLRKDDDVLGKIIKVSFSQDVDENSVLALLSDDTDVEYIQKANTYKMDSVIPNDSLISEQWALEKIKAYDAWEITQGSDSVLLGIIDTGIDYEHPDLVNQIFFNSGEIGFDNKGNDKRSNRVDDDGNGFIDDYQGWDFTDRVGFPFDSTGGDYLTWDNNPFDDQGHGTYVAGIAAAQSNNSIGISGVAPKIKLLNLRAFDPGGYGEEDDVAAAILYAVKMGCKVINMSFGDEAFSYVLRDVIQYAYSQDVVLVASSGNSGADAPHYPSGYSEVICVGNSTEQDYIAGSSNYGSTLDIVAPGSSIVTTAKNNSYASISGTSASAPFVSASAALILSINNFTNEEVKQILKSTTDDIGQNGWDLKSGAGRLNIFKALTVTAPSVIKFYNPTQDFATSGDTISIRVSVFSPYFTSYSLYVGTGLNPTTWDSLVENGLYQIANEEIFNLNVSNYSDTVYTLRLVINQSTGRNLEERVNFYIDRTPPVADLISVIPSYYGDKSTPLAAVYTNEPSIVRMYYRPTGETDFKFITLDGFTINNQFVKQLHYGFIPKDIVKQNSNYEIYFEAENLVGLKSQITDNGNYFNISTNYNAEYAAEYLMPYSLPAGNIFEKPVNITSNDYSDIILRTDTNPKVSGIYNFSNQSFTKIDSLNNRIVKDFGDFNNNGLLDLLTFLVRDGFVDEQVSSNSSSFSQQYSNAEDGTFWPILADDIDSDGTVEVFSVSSDTTVDVWEVQSNLNLNKVATLNNFSPIGLGDNIINSPNAVIADIDQDGINEYWMVDADGDIFSYKINGNSTFTKQYLIQTEFYGNSAYITKGDYDGDGKDDIAVMLHSVDDLDISPYYRTIVFNLAGSSLNIIFDHAFIDAATEFNNNFSKAENGIRLTDINNDGKDELILFVFPYSYIFQRNQSGDQIINFKENINSNSIFVGDINKNGVPEIAFPYSDKIIFSEFSISNSPRIPYNLEGYSLNSSTVELNWFGTGEKYYIYKGLNKNNLQLIDSTADNTYQDGELETNTNYYYAVRAFDSGKQNQLSSLSKVIEVYSHAPAKPVNAVSNSNRSVIVTFSDKIKNTIDNIQSFEVPDIGFPNSISPNNQYSYLLSFDKDLTIGELSVVIKDLKDYYNSPISTDTLKFNVPGNQSAQSFYVTSYEIINAYKIKIKFNFNVDELSVLNTNNYIFQPDNKVASVTVDPSDRKTIYLDLSNQKPVGSIGKEYVLRIKNLTSDFTSGNISINEGAGSYIVLSSFATNLADVYVYPNPVRNLSDETNITFANLPKQAKISIWSIDGKFINEIEETDGNGGVDFNLKNENGDKLSTGIYIYRIVQLDDEHNEGEEKLGKFAIIK
ncbi:MAG: S8 family serine peptidase [Ignavibacteriaceae bacterium]